MDHHFRKNENGKYCIPGSSVRGLIRNNVQILGFSSFEDDIDDYALMYRNVANGAEKGSLTKMCWEVIRFQLELIRKTKKEYGS